MDIVVTGRHLTVSDRFRAHIEEKLAKVTQLQPRTRRIEVLVSHEPNRRQAKACDRVEITCHAKGPVVRAEACLEDKYAALDVAMDKLMERLRRQNDRRQVHRGHATRVGGERDRAHRDPERRGRRPLARAPPATSSATRRSRSARRCTARRRCGSTRPCARWSSSGTTSTSSTTSTPTARASSTGAALEPRRPPPRPRRVPRRPPRTRGRMSRQRLPERSDSKACCARTSHLPRWPAWRTSGVIGGGTGSAGGGQGRHRRRP